MAVLMIQFSQQLHPVKNSDMHAYRTLHCRKQEKGRRVTSIKIQTLHKL
jgi:hypothetical protein